MVALSSSNPAVASVPASVTVASGTTAVGFTVTTTGVSYDHVGHDLGNVRRHHPHRDADGHRRPLHHHRHRSDRDLDGHGHRSQWRTHRLDADRHQRDVGSSGSASFAAGTSVTLRVSSGREAIWSGACSSGGNKTKSCTFTANANTTVSANVQ